MDQREPINKNILLLGALLTILGLGTFALIRFDPAKWTALLPALFGILFLLLGSVAQKRQAWHRTLLYTALGLAFFALLGTSEGLVKTAALMLGEDVERPTTAVEQAITAMLCAGFLGTAIKRVFATRRAKVSQGA